ncbi:UNVERIFIED_CONTAM: Transposon Tf2-12 polyprotein [Sesamum latifolium]|uniref:Transposon Tf2-12 polyprotein n=1 Tax=Sesamum latifolium TaxID=2727402 RepID=A0AAW2U298_9LAMI
MWISSIVPVRKKNGQIRVCVDFKDLNNACPKDDFPLPIVELMIDATTSHEALSFMDGSSGYNQIRMAPVDEELTAFRILKVIYCYKVMPFGLKNAGATYQGAVVVVGGWPCCWCECTLPPEPAFVSSTTVAYPSSFTNSGSGMYRMRFYENFYATVGSPAVGPSSSQVPPQAMECTATTTCSTTATNSVKSKANQEANPTATAIVYRGNLSSFGAHKRNGGTTRMPCQELFLGIMEECQTQPHSDNDRPASSRSSVAPTEQQLWLSAVGGQKRGQVFDLGFKAHHIIARPSQPNLSTAPSPSPRQPPRPDLDDRVTKLEEWMQRMATTWPAPLPAQPSQSPTDPLAPDDEDEDKAGLDYDFFICINTI